MMVDPNIIVMPFAEWMRPGTQYGGGAKPVSMRSDGKQVEYRTFH